MALIQTQHGKTVYSILSLTVHHNSAPSECVCVRACVQGRTCMAHGLCSHQFRSIQSRLLSLQSIRGFMRQCPNPDAWWDTQHRWDIGLLMACVHLHPVSTACMQHCLCVPFLQQVHAVIPLSTFKGHRSEETLSTLAAACVHAKSVFYNLFVFIHLFFSLYK